jgi:hypothetical protein
LRGDEIEGCIVETSSAAGTAAHRRSTSSSAPSPNRKHRPDDLTEVKVGLAGRSADVDAGRIDATVRRRMPASATMLPLVLTTGGCAPLGSPSLVLFGAYFPAWMLCALIGIGAALVARAALVTIGLDALLAFRLFSYTSIALIVGALGWLFCFGPGA